MIAPPRGFELISAHRCFGGVQMFLKHDSAEIGLPMRLAVYLPPAAVAAAGSVEAVGALGQRVPSVVYLAGLTCTEETFTIKAGAQHVAAELGLALIMPDTSPRGAGVAGESDRWDFGVAAGFYLDATEAPWAQHWRMESYLMRELLPALAHPTEGLPIAPMGEGGAMGIMGHSMGGHGALVLAHRHPGVFASLSAFAPICAPTQCPWGQRALGGYLGQNPAAWAAHDACELIRQRAEDGLPALYPAGILVDQGLADKFLEAELHPHLLEAACEEAGQPLRMRRHEGYDHGYYFIASFVESHLRHHAARLFEMQ